MKLFKFENNQSLTSDLSQLQKKPEYKQAQKGKWYHWQRIYLIKSSNDKEFGLVSLNFFERLGRNFFKVDLFKNEFKDKKITVVSPKDVTQTIQKIQNILKNLTRPIETSYAMPVPKPLFVFQEPDQAEWEIFHDLVQSGHQQLAAKGAAGKSNLETHSYLIDKLLMDQPVTIITPIPTEKGVGQMIVVRDDPKYDKLLLPLRFGKTAKDCQKEAALWVSQIPIINQQRIDKGQEPYKTIFFPFVVPGFFADHGILGVIELNPENGSQANITVIDPFGKHSGYKNRSIAVAEGLASAFPSSSTRIIFNGVRQQKDRLTCGFHQMLNIRDLLKQSNIQNFVEEKHLQSRSIATINQIVRPS